MTDGDHDFDCVPNSVDDDWENFQQNTGGAISWEDILDEVFQGEFDEDDYEHFWDNSHDGWPGYFKDDLFHEIIMDFLDWLFDRGLPDEHDHDGGHQTDCWEPPFDNVAEDRTISCQWFYVKDCGNVSTPNWWQAFDEIIPFGDAAQYRDWVLGEIINKHQLNINSTDLDGITKDCDVFAPDFEGCVLDAYSFATTPVSFDFTGPIIDLATRLECFETANNDNYLNSVTLSADQPIANSSEAYNHTDRSVGHTFITISQVAPNGETKILSFGFYPDGSKDINPFTHSKSPSNFRHDEGHIYDVSMTWNLSKTQFNLIINAAKTIAAQLPEYDLDSYNCTTFAVNLLNQGGLGIPQNPGSWPGGGGLNPGRLGEDLRNMTIESWMSIITDGGVAPYSLKCP